MATMTAAIPTAKKIAGGAFLISDATAADCFFPEDFSDESSQISLFSPIGTALLGLKVGDETRVFLAPTGFHGLHVAGVRPEKRPS